jgi:hypothetical protein
VAELVLFLKRFYVRAHLPPAEAKLLLNVREQGKAVKMGCGASNESMRAEGGVVQRAVVPGPEGEGKSTSTDTSTSKSGAFSRDLGASGAISSMALATPTDNSRRFSRSCSLGDSALYPRSFHPPGGTADSHAASPRERSLTCDAEELEWNPNFPYPPLLTSGKHSCSGVAPLPHQQPASPNTTAGAHAPRFTRRDLAGVTVVSCIRNEREFNDVMAWLDQIPRLRPVQREQNAAVARSRSP